MLSQIKTCFHSLLSFIRHFVYSALHQLLAPLVSQQDKIQEGTLLISTRVMRNSGHDMIDLHRPNPRG